MEERCAGAWQATSIMQRTAALQPYRQEDLLQMTAFDKKNVAKYHRSLLNACCRKIRQRKVLFDRRAGDPSSGSGSGGSSGGRSRSRG